jgi:hypothetical protein
VWKGKGDTATNTHAERLKREQTFHDQQASRITVTPGRGGWVDCESPAWPNEPKIQPTMTKRRLRLLGDFAGKSVLVYGCGCDPGAARELQQSTSRPNR